MSEMDRHGRDAMLSAAPEGGARQDAIPHGFAEEITGLAGIQGHGAGYPRTSGRAEEDSGTGVDRSRSRHPLRTNTRRRDSELGGEGAAAEIDAQRAAIYARRHQRVGRVAVRGCAALQTEIRHAACGTEEIGSILVAEQEVVAIADGDLVAAQRLHEGGGQIVTRHGVGSPAAPDQSAAGRQHIHHRSRVATVRHGGRRSGATDTLLLQDRGDLVRPFQRIDWLEHRLRRCLAIDQGHAVHAVHAAREFPRTGGAAGTKTFGTAGAVERRENDGALVYQDDGAIRGGLGDEVGSLDANGHQRRVQAELVAGHLCRQPGDATNRSRFEVELDQGFGGIGRVVAVFDDVQHRIRPHADPRAIDEANVHMAVSGGADNIAGGNVASLYDRLALAFALNLAGADAEGHFADRGGRAHCRYQQCPHHHHPAQASAKQPVHRGDPLRFNSRKDTSLASGCDVRTITRP
ncbi:hypothetical protein ACCAA_560050 [Candidatus Accumulibacter aalborgensis]|uniref:Uncharacterized protein n=1 Tax=Candidatus Accumulibacter aalborgensis TaxID=1860102 RepID=A0A1A8XWH9_9PROT|nr:hypothetical protein ACCAA_560050 [Candidatus Accumulibacter aalborgensis]